MSNTRTVYVISIGIEKYQVTREEKDKIFELMKAGVKDIFIRDEYINAGNISSIVELRKTQEGKELAGYGLTIRTDEVYRDYEKYKNNIIKI